LTGGRLTSTTKKNFFEWHLNNNEKKLFRYEMSGRKPHRWRVEYPYTPIKALIRMSWHPTNLRNLLQRQRPQDLSRKTVYQQRWTAKKQLRAYHVPNITEKQFLARHFNTTLPVQVLSEKDRNAFPAYQSLMFGELERRLDVVVFRSHFAQSIFSARAAVVNGYVTVNGERVLHKSSPRPTKLQTFLILIASIINCSTTPS
jgi:hypothetical protein